MQGQPVPTCAVLTVMLAQSTCMGCTCWAHAWALLLAEWAVTVFSHCADSRLCDLVEPNQSSCYVGSSGLHFLCNCIMIAAGCLQARMLTGACSEVCISPRLLERAHTSFLPWLRRFVAGPFLRRDASAGLPIHPAISPRLHCRAGFWLELISALDRLGLHVCGPLNVHSKL